MTREEIYAIACRKWVEPAVVQMGVCTSAAQGSQRPCSCRTSQGTGGCLFVIGEWVSLEECRQPKVEIGKPASVRLVMATSSRGIRVVAEGASWDEVARKAGFLPGLPSTQDVENPASHALATPSAKSSLRKSRVGKRP